MCFYKRNKRQMIQAYQTQFPQLAVTAYVHPAATVIGEVTLGGECSVWPGVVIRADINSIRIGEGTNIQDGSILHVGHRSSADPLGAPIHIGKYVTIGHLVILHGCTIEDECLIGMGSIVMDKAVIQKNVLLAAGSLVAEGKVLESGYLYVGRPAKKVRALTQNEIADLRVSAEGYIKLKDEYVASSF